MFIFWNLACEAEGDGELLGGIGKSDGGAGAAVAQSVRGGGGAETVGHGSGAVAVAVEHDAETEIGDMAEGHIFFAFPPAMRKILNEAWRKDNRSGVGMGALGKERLVEAGEGSGGAAESASRSITWWGGNPCFSFLFEHGDIGGGGGGGEKHIGSTAGGEDMAMEVVWPRVTGMAFEPASEEPPSAAGVVGGLARLEGKVGRLDFLKSCKISFSGARTSRVERRRPVRWVRMERRLRLPA